MGSYLLECMILQIYEDQEPAQGWWIDLEFQKVLLGLSKSILNDVEDPKGIQGNINNFNADDRKKISEALHTAYDKAVKASTLESSEKQKEAINKWREVLGNDFPEYTED